jgi:ribonuclease HI
MTDPEEQRPCIERVDKLLQEAMEQCYPTCWEQAWAHFERTNAMCALKQDPEEKEICLKESDRVYAEWTQGCDQRECHEKAHQIAEAGFKECETTDPNADGVTDAAELAECQK